MADDRMTTALRFDGRTALVTGAGRGLGKAYAIHLAARGAKVVVNDPGVSLDGTGGDRAPAQAVADEIVAAGGRAVANFESVATDEGARAMIDQAVGTFGSIDIVINNAGNFVPRRGVVDTTTESMNAVWEVHLIGTLNTIRAAWPHMTRSAYGRIVNTTSHIGYLGSRNNLPYAAAKGAIHGLTRSLSFEGEDVGIRVNGIAPGALTRPVRRIEGIEERLPAGSFDADLVAPTVAWLAHELCPVNGEFFGIMSGTTTRIKIAETPGYSCRTPGPEEIRDHFHEIMDQALLDRSGLSFGIDGESRGQELASRFAHLS